MDISVSAEEKKTHFEKTAFKDMYCNEINNKMCIVDVFLFHYYERRQIMDAKSQNVSKKRLG